MAENKATVKTLNGLLSTGVNAREGYRTAAQNVSDSNVKTFFNQTAQSRATLVAELEQMIRDAGGTPDSSGTAAGKAHRGWISARSSLSGGSTKSLLKECERGEDHAVEQYEEALKEDLSESAKGTLKDQLQQVRTDLSRLRELQREFA